MSRLFALVLAALAPLAAGAAEFGVSPIRLYFEPGTRSAAVVVTNDDSRPLRMQLRLMQWTQDADGADVHADSDELIYFPRLMTVPPGEKRLVRVGLKSPAGAAERTYRLYLDELPAGPDAAALPAASGLNFTIRFALPVFLPPAAAAKPAGAIESLTLSDGKLRIAVRNTGNRHFRIASLEARSGRDSLASVAGWYLLAGAGRIHTIEIPAEVCRGLRRLDVTVKAEELSLERGLDVEPRMCAP
jgi:fimbrial chaperone protein